MQKRKWTTIPGQASRRGTETIRWQVVQQYRIDGGMDVDIIVTCFGLKGTSVAAWDGVTLTAQALDSVVAHVTLGEMKEAAEAGDSRRLLDLLELLKTA